MAVSEHIGLDKDGYPEKPVAFRGFVNLILRLSEDLNKDGLTEKAQLFAIGITEKAAQTAYGKSFPDLSTEERSRIDYAMHWTFAIEIGFWEDLGGTMLIFSFRDYYENWEEKYRELFDSSLGLVDRELYPPEADQ